MWWMWLDGLGTQISACAPRHHIFRADIQYRRITAERRRHAKRELDPWKGCRPRYASLDDPHEEVLAPM